MAPAFLITALPADSPDTDFESRLRPILPEERVLSIHDAGATRGDGIFETVGMNNGVVNAASAHVERLARSASLLDLPQPNRAQWHHAIQCTADELPAHGSAVLRLVMTRGMPDSRTPTCWISGRQADSEVTERTAGVRVALLDRGWPIDIGTRAPWVLAGAKSLSYAPNMAAVREARRRGADDVVYVSLEGYALEGPTSSLIMREGDTFVTPTAGSGILPGTTQRAVFELLDSLGHSTRSELVRAERLARADAAWLVSSIRLAVPITAIDGTAIGVDAELTARMNEHLLRGEGAALS